MTRLLHTLATHMIYGAVVVLVYVVACGLVGGAYLVIREIT